MAIILPNTRGHYPKGYPKYAGVAGNSSSYNPGDLERASDTPDLQTFKTAVTDAQGTSMASDYLTRNACARDWRYSRWQYQTVDGRKWGDPNAGIQPWPWPGAADTRCRTVEKMMGQRLTLDTFALRNMKVQAKSTRPAVTIRESQQATTLLNWMLFSHMQAELHRELRLGLSCRNEYGSSILHLCWKQSRQLDYIPVSVMGLNEFINEPAVAAFVGGGNNIPIGENLSITDLQEMIMDPAYADDLATLLRAVSHDLLTLKAARKKLDDLRQIRTVEIPVPYVFESRPQITTLRTMVDVLFPERAGDLQIVPWTDRIELVSETTLRDRIETAGYSKAFVEEVLDHRGPSSGADWRLITDNSVVTSPSIMENDIELHHFYTLVQDRGVPIRFCTVFHMDLDFAAKHEPTGYKHGQSCFHPLRYEISDRPILSSRGIPEIAYTWEQELKAQYDAQTDRTALSLRPPLMTTYNEMQKLKENLQPGVVFPMRSFDQYEFMKLPPWDQVSILVIQEVEKRVREHFAIFGADVDPELKKLRREEHVDDLLSELKPVKQQMMKLLRDLLPDAEVAAVVGTLNRPFQISRKEIQAEYEISATVDLRNLDSEWLDKKLDRFAQIFALDARGQLNKTPILKAALESADYSLAESALPDDQQAVTEAEVQEEKRALREIIASGADVEIPKGANAQLRLQTGRAYMQELIQSNPVVQRRLQENPEILKVLQTRSKSFAFELQQIENAQIGRMGTTQTFTKQAPQVAEGSALLNY